MKYQSAGRGGRIDILSQRPESGSRCLKLIDDLEKVFQAAREAVVFCDDNHVPLSKFPHHLAQIGTRSGSACDCVCENALCPGGGQRVMLTVDLLICRGDPRIS